MIRTSAINLVLKVGLAITSIAFAVLSFFKATDIIVFYPEFITNIFGELFTIALGAAVAIVLAIWLLSRKHKFAAAFTYTIIIFLAILFNLNSIRFLSVAWPLFCMSFALSLRYYPRIRVIISKKLGNQKIEKMKIVPAFPEDDVEEFETPTTSGSMKDSANKYSAVDTLDNQQKFELREDEIAHSHEESIDQFPIERDIEGIAPLHYRVEEISDENSLNAIDNLNAPSMSDEAETLEVREQQVVPNNHYARKHGVATRKKVPVIRATHSHTEEDGEISTDPYLDIEENVKPAHSHNSELKKVPRIKIAKKLTHRIAHKIGLGRKSKKNDIEVQ